MPNVEWEVQHDLITPAGNLTFNVPDPITGYWYILDPASYKIVPTLRVTQDNLSQADGSILHPRWKTGLIATMKVTYAIQEGGTGSKDYIPACDGDLRVMHETLTKLLNSIRVLTQNQQRFIWTPSPLTGGPALSRRMMDFVQCLAWADPAQLSPGVEVAFTLESPLPYAIDLTQQTQSIIVSATITNPVPSAFKPVVKVYGPFGAFTLVNADDLDAFGNPKAVFYDSTRPGAHVVTSGNYAEIDFVRGSIFLNGNSTDLTAGLDPSQTDFWSLLPGSNAVTLAGGPPSCDVLWNPAWS